MLTCIQYLQTVTEPCRKENCEHRRIASQKITINAIQMLDSPQLDRLQRVLDHIAYDKEYYMPERGFGMRR